jgi:hypothetical protein
MNAWDKTHCINNVKIKLAYFSHFLHTKILAFEYFLHIRSEKSQKFPLSKDCKIIWLFVILNERSNIPCSILEHFSLNRHTMISNNLLKLLPLFSRLTLAEYHEQEEIFKLRLGHLKKVKKIFLEKCNFYFTSSMEIVWSFGKI